MPLRQHHTDVTTIVALAIAQSVVVAVVIAIGAAAEGGAPPIAYLLALGSGVIVLAADRFPVVALAAGIGIVIVYYILDLPAIGVAVPILGTVYLAALAGHITAAAIAATVLIALAAYFRAVQGSESSGELAYDTVTNAALIAATLALAATLVARRATARQQRRVRELERRALESQLDGERLRISRELHDRLGHQLVTVAVFASVAAEARDDEQRSMALRHVHEGTRSALEELRSAIRALRTGTLHIKRDDAEAAVSATTAVLRSAGYHVESAVDQGINDLPVEVQQCAVRLIEEAVTNILKHADADRIAIRLSREDGVLAIRVHDDGGARTFSAGAGIHGMRARADELGGTLHVTADATGFTVEARLPEGDVG